MFEEVQPGATVNIDGEEWEFIGRVAVDSGQMMLSDPCYVKDFEHDQDKPWDGENKAHKGEYSYDGASYATLHGGYGMLDGFMGAVCSTGWGDGQYPVLVKHDKHHGRIQAMMVDFDNVSGIEGEKESW